MNVAVLGAGGWGTALSIVLDRGKHAVRLWAYEAALAASLEATRENEIFLKGVRLPDGVRVTHDLAEAVRRAEMILFVPPSHALRSVATRLLEEAPGAFAAAPLVVVATKGLETGTLRRMSEVLAEALPEPAGRDVVVLAGPSHAEEVARQVPTAIVAACRAQDRAQAVQEAVSTDWFRVYRNEDVIGVELAVSLKNVVAIAAGISDGLDFGDSTKAALLTRGLVEIARLGGAMGARPETFAGLAGMGDLIATATSRHSRNRRLGEAIGRGATLEKALASSPMVAEGVGTCEAAVSLAQRHGVELPIAEQVHAILFEGKSARAALRELLTRDLKPEAERRVRRPS